MVLTLLSGIRGVVVLERGGTPFRQIFLSQNGALVNIVYRSRKSAIKSYLTHEIGPICFQQNQ